MELDDYPLLNTPNVMLVALRTAARAPALPEDCVDRLLEQLRRARTEPPDDLTELRLRVAVAFRYLCVAALLDPDEAGRCALTSRGEAALEEHPTGIDDSVLMAYPEFRSYIARPRPFHQRDDQGAPVVEPKSAYFEGFSAHGDGRSIADNPYESDVNDHLEWEQGWCEGASEAHSRKRRS